MTDDQGTTPVAKNLSSDSSGQCPPAGEELSPDSKLTKSTTLESTSNDQSPPPSYAESEQLMPQENLRSFNTHTPQVPPLSLGSQSSTLVGVSRVERPAASNRDSELTPHSPLTHTDFMTSNSARDESSAVNPNRLDYKSLALQRSPSVETKSSTSTSASTTPSSAKSPKMHSFPPSLIQTPQRKYQPPKKSDSPNNGIERCMNPKRRSTRLRNIPGTRVFTDCTDLEPHQVEALKKKAILLELLADGKQPRGQGGRSRFASPTGQGSLVLKGGKLRIISAHHNVMHCTKTYEREWGEMTYHLVFMGAYVLMDAHERSQNVRFKGEAVHEGDATWFDLQPHVYWEAGWDVTKTQPISCVTPKRSDMPWFKRLLQARRPTLDPVDEFGFTPEELQEKTFDSVSSNFKFEVGQKVGIVVSSVGMTETATPKNTGMAEGEVPKNKVKTQEEIDDIYGPPDCVAIYKGEIKAVHKNHIVHDINTYKGCSGAIVFLWNGSDQLESVPDKERGKAFAVHVGNKISGGGNIGLLINNGTSPPWRYRLKKFFADAGLVSKIPPHLRQKN